MSERDRHADTSLPPLRDVIALARMLPLPPDDGDVEERRAQLIALSERPTRRPRMGRVVVAMFVPVVAAAAVAAVVLRPVPVSVPVPMAGVLPSEPTNDTEESFTSRKRNDIASVSGEVPRRNEESSSLAIAPRAPYRTTSIGRKTASASASHLTRANHDVTTIAVSNVSQAQAADEVAFQQGIAALQAGNFSLAITELEIVVADPNSPVIEDGHFWIAVAYARAKRTRAAIDAFESFLDHHPTSVRFREASTMLAWQLLSLGAVDRARALFEKGIADANPTVQRSARAGLKTIGDRSEQSLR